MIEKKKYTFRALLNKEIWKEFDRLSLKSKKKDKKNTEIKRIETKRFFDTEKFKRLKIIKFLKSSFFRKKSEVFTFFFTFESKKTINKKIETNDVESFFSLTLNTSRRIESSFEKASVTRKKTSMTQNNASNDTIESISFIHQKLKISKKKAKMKDSSIKSFWDRKDKRKNSNEYLKDIEFIYQTSYKSQKTMKKDKTKYKNNVHRILFRQNFRRNVENWYFDLSKIVKSDWKVLRTSFKTQFEMKIDAEANKYLLLQRMITLTQKLDESITNYFQRTKSLTRHMSNAIEIIKYNVVKKMKNKVQRKWMNFECNKNKNFSLKKIELIIQTTCQTINIMNLFDLEWNHSRNSFNHIKKKEKALLTNEWNQ
jgi:hypothetical protein